MRTAACLLACALLLSRATQAADEVYFESPLDGPLRPWDELRERLNRHGLDYWLAYSPQIQYGNQKSRQTTANHELDFVGEWQLLESERVGSGGFQWWFLHRRTLGNFSTEEFSGADGAGSPYGLNGGDTGDDRNLNRVEYFHWQQLLLDDALRILVGKLDAEFLGFQSDYVGNPRVDFFADVVTGNEVAAMHQKAGLGVFASYTRERWYLSAMVRDAEANQDWFDFSHLHRGNRHAAVELAFTPSIGELGPGTWRATYYHHDETTVTASSGYAYALSIDQALGARHAAFFRYTRAERQLERLQSQLATGLMFLAPAGSAHDLAGVAFSWAKPSGSDPDDVCDQYAIEAMWRLQLTRRVQLTPDLQFIWDPSTGGERFRFVSGLRLRIEF